MAYEEVAEVLNVSVGTVKSRILRGRRMLREMLEPMLRSPHGAQNAPAPRGQESVLHSPLFSVAEKKNSSRSDTTGWADPGEPGEAEGGVLWTAKK
jgi:hypothetical protein